MMTRIRVTSFMMTAIFASMLTGRLVAEDSCHHCGECKEIKYKLCLVRVYEEAELPVYECQQETVFCPTKAAVEHCGPRCDTFMRLEKCGQTPMPVVESCGCESGCDSHCCPPPTWAGQIYYKRECCSKQSCSRLGACPDGCHVPATVSRPNGEKCNVTVPVLKWVRVPICNECCHR